MIIHWDVIAHVAGTAITGGIAVAVAVSVACITVGIIFLPARLLLDEEFRSHRAQDVKRAWKVVVRWRARIERMAP